MAKALSEISDCVSAGAPVPVSDFAQVLGVDVATIERFARVGHPEHPVEAAVQMLIRDFMLRARELLDPVDPDADFKLLQSTRPDLGNRLLMSLVGERTIARPPGAA